MGSGDRVVPPGVSAFFGESGLGIPAYRAVVDALDCCESVEVGVTRSQVVFQRRVGFAWLWLPGRWLDMPDVEVVLSIGLRERIESRRFKEIVEPARGRWMHHLELPDLATIDDEVRGWLRRAWESAA